MVSGIKFFNSFSLFLWKILKFVLTYKHPYTSVEFETISDEYLENSIPHIDMILENKHEQHF